MAYRDSSPEEKAKAAARQRAWREANPERWAAIARPSRKKWRANNVSKHRECQRTHRYTVRREILILLGGEICVHCGYDKDWRCLQIDHIHGGGRHDPRTNVGSGTNMWALRNWLIGHQDEARLIYQVLCANCNWIKRHENGEQPNGKVQI
jgi:hypothetical protein